MTAPAKPVDLFYSYAHEDEVERDELDAHLALLKRRGVIRTWHDRAVEPGASWRPAIDAHLETADVILFLVSKSFFASDFIWEQEMPRALARHTAGEAAVVPIIVKPVDLEDAPFGGVQTLPTDRRPVTTWANRDEAWVDVVQGIRRAVARVAGAAPVAPSRLPDAPPAEASHAYDRAIARFSGAVLSAYALRSLPTPAPDAVEAVGDTLAGVQEPKRILWVDDHPENNVAETAALRRMQFEVQARTSTEDALEALAHGDEPYDLVISDWNRLTLRNLLEPEGLRLLRAIRAAGLPVPVAFYHGILAPDALEARRRTVRDAGGQLATYRPDELLAFVATTFGSPPA